MKYIHPRRLYRRSTKRLSEFFEYYVLPDSWEIRYRFKKSLGYKCNLNHPRSFNEKIQWLKLHDRNPLYSQLTDKIAVKQIVAQTIGEQYVIPSLSGGYNRFEDIPFDSLPSRFVIKCNHDSYSTIVCADKEQFDFEGARDRINKALKRNFYHYKGKQWGYKNIKPQVFVEKYMAEDGEGRGLTDYKFYMFNGICRCILVFVDRFSSDGPRLNCYDPEWNLLPFSKAGKSNSEELDKPDNLDEMLNIAAELSKVVHNSFVRIDLYNIKGKIYFGEYTFYPGNGFDSFYPAHWDYELGDWLQLTGK